MSSIFCLLELILSDARIKWLHLVFQFPFEVLVVSGYFLTIMAMQRLIWHLWICDGLIQVIWNRYFTINKRGGFRSENKKEDEYKVWLQEDWYFVFALDGQVIRLKTNSILYPSFLRVCTVKKSTTILLCMEDTLEREDLLIMNFDVLEV